MNGTAQVVAVGALIGGGVIAVALVALFVWLVVDAFRVRRAWPKDPK